MHHKLKTEDIFIKRKKKGLRLFEIRHKTEGDFQNGDTVEYIDNLGFPFRFYSLIVYCCVLDQDIEFTVFQEVVISKEELLSHLDDDTVLNEKDDSVPF